MIAFGPEKDAPGTRLQRVARRALVGVCSVLGLGVVSSVVRLSAAPPLAQAVLATQARVPAGEARFSAMAAARPAPVVELVHDAVPARPTTAAPTRRVVWMWVTAYCPCAKCCGKHATGLTASGKPITANYGHFVAAPAELPFGTKVSIPGYNRGRPVPVLDRGGAIRGDRMDVFFASHDQARQWGVRIVPVTIAGN